MLYRTIRTLTGRKDHFQEQFNNPAPPLDPVLMAEAASATTDPSVDSIPPTADEISAAIRKLKKNRAPGICGITAELLKSGGAPVVSWMLPLFTLI